MVRLVKELSRKRPQEEVTGTAPQLGSEAGIAPESPREYGSVPRSVAEFLNTHEIVFISGDIGGDNGVDTITVGGKLTDVKEGEN